MFFVNGTSVTIPDGLAGYLEGNSYSITIYPINAEINLNKVGVFQSSGSPDYENMKIEIAAYSNPDTDVTF